MKGIVMNERLPVFVFDKAWSEPMAALRVVDDIEAISGRVRITLWQTVNQDVHDVIHQPLLVNRLGGYLG